MKIVLGGIRGSWPIARPEYLRYGGETTSLLVAGEKGERIIFDMGTGARRLGERLRAEPPALVNVFFTHFHLDHLIGLPAFAPIYDAAFSLEFAAPPHRGQAVDDVLPRLLAPPFWPLQMDDLHAQIAFRRLPPASDAAPRQLGGLTVSWCPVAHPDGGTAYRVDEPSTGASFVLATDVEWQVATPAERAALEALCRASGPPGLLLFDGHYSDEEYDAHRGWGHSCMNDALTLARACDARAVRLIHHAQTHTDSDLDRLDAEVRRRSPIAALAREGEEYDGC